MPRSTSRSSASPSITNSSAGCATAGVSCATWESTQRGGIETSPASACSSPRMSAKRLDLPAPLGPTRPAFWPGWTFIDASCSRTRAARRRVRSVMRSTFRILSSMRRPASLARAGPRLDRRLFRRHKMRAMPHAPSAATNADADAFRREFVAFAIDAGVLRFGEFRTKAGRLSPYFFNAGLFDDGAKMAALGGYYAQALQASGIGYDMLFGPAYKGITLAAVTAVSLAAHGHNVPFCFNR